jgi:hypothetical protein
MTVCSLLHMVGNSPLPAVIWRFRHLRKFCADLFEKPLIEPARILKAMPCTHSSIDKIRAELDWVTETPDPNKCGCRNLRCCEETGHNPGAFHQTYFFQDTWVAAPSVSLTLGLRYENFGQPANILRYPAGISSRVCLFCVRNIRFA